MSIVRTTLGLCSRGLDLFPIYTLKYFFLHKTLGFQKCDFFKTSPLIQRVANVQSYREVLNRKVLQIMLVYCVFLKYSEIIGYSFVQLYMSHWHPRMKQTSG